MWKLTAIAFSLLKMTAIGTAIAAFVMATSPTSPGIPINDPWFIVFVVWNLFSALTSGMPEPDEESSFGYIWLFRSCHILSAQGTAYFIHKKRWKDISGGGGDDD